MRAVVLEQEPREWLDVVVDKDEQLATSMLGAEVPGRSRAAPGRLLHDAHREGHPRIARQANGIVGAAVGDDDDLESFRRASPVA
jgi:hypothetical protein